MLVARFRKEVIIRRHDHPLHDKPVHPLRRGLAQAVVALHPAQSPCVPARYGTPVHQAVEVVNRCQRVVALLQLHAPLQHIVCPLLVIIIVTYHAKSKQNALTSNHDLLRLVVADPAATTQLSFEPSSMADVPEQRAV